MKTHQLFPITEATHVGEARRYAVSLAHQLRFSETQAGQLALIVTECATNMIKHTASGGRLLIRPLSQATIPKRTTFSGALNQDAGIEVIALDKGRGIASIANALRDGFSTAGSTGTGLGAIQRLSTVFDLYSTPGSGTALFAQLWTQTSSTALPLVTPPPEPSPSLPVQFGVVCVPKLGQTASGDSWAVTQDGSQLRLMVVDGLGHGLGASQAAQTAVETFERRSPTLSIETLMQDIHASLQQTRGAVLSIADIAPHEHKMTYAGVGNIDGRLYGGNYTTEPAQHMVSHNGTVGYEMRRVQSFTYLFPDNGTVILNSDGCTSQLSMRPYPGLGAKHPTLIAAVLYRDFSRETDDTTVAVVKVAASPRHSATM